MLNRIALSGPMGVGKDYVADQAGFHRMPVSYPLHRIASALLNVDSEQNKDNPEVRRFLQRVGGWGRGDAGDYTVERAVMTAHLREHGHHYVDNTSLSDWTAFGRSPSFWASMLMRRYFASTHIKIAATGVRFPSEREMLEAAGFEHYVVLAAPETRATRLRRPPTDTENKDATEQWWRVWWLEYESMTPSRLIWNDDPESPSRPKNTMTVAEFVEATR